METARLLTALRAANPQLTPLEAAEALWLACTAGPLAGPAARVDTGAVPAAEDETADIPSPAPLADPPRSPSAPERTSVRVPTDPGRSAQLAEGSRVSVPDASALPSGRAIQRALKPLKRRVPTARRLALDEEATAQAIAETGAWTPVFRPTSEKWLDLALVVEATPSMAPWEALIDDLQKSLLQLGAFRDVRRWQIHASRRRRGLGISREQQTRTGPEAREDRKPSELIDPSGRRIFFVVTDASSAVWRDGAGGEVLGTWSRHSPVVVLQPLPERLWHRTGLRTRRGTFRSSIPGGSTRDLTFVERRRRPRPLLPDETAVPVVEISPSWLRSWCSMVTGAYGDTTPLAAAVVSVTGADIAPITAPTATDGPEADAHLLLGRFRATASPQAFRLATLLSAVPLEPAVIRLVQRTMLPGSGPTHLAEVLLAGIVHTGAGPGDPAGFDFRPGVRGLLLDDLRVSEANHIVEAVSAYIESRGGLPGRAFPAVVSMPGGVPSAVAGEPFAWLPVDALNRLGLAGGRNAGPVERSEAPAEADSTPLPAPADANALQRFAERLDDMFDGDSARILKGVVKPVEIMNALRLETEASKAVLSDQGTLVPNRFVVDLSPYDHTRLAPYAAMLAQELAVSEAEFIGDRAYTVYGDVIVEIERSDGLDTGMFRVTAEVYTGEPVPLNQASAGQRGPVLAVGEIPPRGTGSSFVSRLWGSSRRRNNTYQRLEQRLNDRTGGAWSAAASGARPPADLLKAMWEEADSLKIQLGGNKIRPPDIYVIELPQSDLDRLGPHLGALATELARSVVDLISEQPTWTLRAGVVAKIAHNAELREGTFRVTAEYDRSAVIVGYADSTVRRPADGETVLQRFENRLDAMVEGESDGVFRGVVHPREVLNALHREAEAQKAYLADGRALVPNRCVIDFSPNDHSRLSRFEGRLAHELAQSQAEFISENGYVVYGDVTVEMEPDHGLETGFFRVTVEVYTQTRT